MSTGRKKVSAVLIGFLLGLALVSIVIYLLSCRISKKKEQKETRVAIKEHEEAEDLLLSLHSKIIVGTFETNEDSKYDKTAVKLENAYSATSVPSLAPFEEPEMPERAAKPVVTKTGPFEEAEKPGVAKPAVSKTDRFEEAKMPEGAAKPSVSKTGHFEEAKIPEGAAKPSVSKNGHFEEAKIPEGAAKPSVSKKWQKMAEGVAKPAVLSPNRSEKLSAKSEEGFYEFSFHKLFQKAKMPFAKTGTSEDSAPK